MVYARIIPHKESRNKEFFSVLIYGELYETERILDKYRGLIKERGDKNRVNTFLITHYILDFLAKNNFIPVSENFFYKK